MQAGVNLMQDGYPGYRNPELPTRPVRSCP